jgi:hypothetical protein
MSNNVEVKQQSLIKISNIFAALENVDANLDIKRNWEQQYRVIENIRQREPRNVIIS